MLVQTHTILFSIFSEGKTGSLLKAPDNISAAGIWRMTAFRSGNEKTFEGKDGTIGFKYSWDRKKTRKGL